MEGALTITVHGQAKVAFYLAEGSFLQKNDRWSRLMLLLGLMGEKEV